MNERLSPLTLFGLVVGLFIVCCLGLLFWIQGRPTARVIPVPVTQVVPTSSTASIPASTERWITQGKSFDVPDAIIKQQCLNVGCEQGWRIIAETKHNDEQHILLTKTLSRPTGEPLQGAFQLGRLGDPNARLALTIPSITSCDNDLMGCGPTFILRLSDLDHPDRAIVLQNSTWLPEHQMVWSPDFRYALGLNGVCEGGCVPEPIVAWSIETGTTTQATSEAAYISTEHYNLRTQGSPAEYLHWSNLRWTSINTFETSLVSSTGTVRTIKGQVK